jgi:pyruvate/2-oxoglutarate dehydrogenase complex dihydrolipoamide dehydrogenase (E3) component
VSSRSFDAIVIGAGPAGEACAGQLAELGLETAIVERELIGGECAYWACMPSKALLRPGELAAETARVPAVSDAVLDPPAALRRRDEVIHELDDGGMVTWLEERGIALVRGAARLVGERRVRVGEELLEARRAVVLAVGSQAAIPDVPGLRDARPWTNREATTATAVPGRLLVLGGGVVGVELAQAWSSLGARVTLVELAPRLLANEEPFASELVAAGLRACGVDVRLDAHVTAVRRESDGTVTLALGEDGAEELAGDEVLVGVGRRPRTEELGLEHVGLEAGASIAVDAQLRVPDHDWLYAIGDVNGRALLTHVGKLQARIAAAHIAGRSDAALRDDGPPPRVVFTDPQVAAVGPTLQAARDAGVRAIAVDTRIDKTAAASFHGKGEDARARFVIDADRERLVGATFVGPDVAELLHAATIAVVGELPLCRIAQAAPSFPTRSELWLALGDWPTAHDA